MITVKANGKTFTFPDGTSNDQIGEAVDEYFSSQPQQPQPQQTQQTQQETIQQPAPVEQPKVQTEYEKAKELAKDIPASQFAPVQEPKPAPMSREAHTSNWQSGSSYYQMGNIDRKTQEDVAKEIAIRETAPFIEEAKQVMMDNPDKYVGRTVFDVAQELGQASRAGDAAETLFAVGTMGIGAPTVLGLKGVIQAAKLGAGLGAGQEAVSQAAGAVALGDTSKVDVEQIAKEGGLGALLGGGLQGAFDIKNLLGQGGEFIGKRAAKSINPEKLAGVQAAAEHNKQALAKSLTNNGIDSMTAQKYVYSPESLSDSAMKEVNKVINVANKEAKKDFIEFMPSQIADKGLGVRAEQLSDFLPSSPFKSSKDKVLEKQTSNAEKAAKSLTDSNVGVAESSVQMGRLSGERQNLPFSAAENTPDSFLGSVVDDVGSELRQKASNKYNENMVKLDEAFKQSPLKIKQLKPVNAIEEAKVILDEAKQRGSLGLSKIYQRQIAELTKQQPKNFSELDDWKKLLNKKAGEAYSKGDYEASDAFKRLAGAVKQDAQIHADALGVDVGNIYKEADQLWKEAMDTTNNKYLKSLVNTNFDADTVRKMIRGESGAEKINEVRNAIKQSDNKMLMPAFQDSVVATIMKEANTKAIGDRASDFNAGAYGKVIRQNQKQLDAALKDNPNLSKNIKVIGDMFDLMRKADTSRGPIQQAIQGIGSKLGGALGFGEVAITGGVPVVTGLGLAGQKLTDMSAAKLGKLMTKYSDEFAKFEKEKNVYVKQEYAEKILKGILAVDDED